MSQVKLEMIWQHDKVLPYILNDLKKQIETITTVHGIMLYGSRAKTNIENWDTLKGKDWDVVMVTDFPIVNTQIWTQDENYHIDLRVIDKKRADEILGFLKQTIELYPVNQLKLSF